MIPISAVPVDVKPILSYLKKPKNYNQTNEKIRSLQLRLKRQIIVRTEDLHSQPILSRRNRLVKPVKKFTGTACSETLIIALKMTFA